MTIAAVVLAGIALRVRDAASVPAERIDRIQYLRNEIVGLGVNGKLLFRHALPSRNDGYGDESDARHGRYAIADLDDDGEPEAIVGVRLRTDAGARDDLYCFGSDGRLRWSQRLEDEIEFRSGRYAPPWHDGRVVVFRSPDGVRIAWSQNHLTWWPSVVLTLDRDGRRLERFVHSGSIRSLAVRETREGPLLLAAGISNAQRAASLAVIDGLRPGGRSPEPPGSAYECLGCGARGPLRYFVFPPSELNAAVGLPYNSARAVDVRGERTVVQTTEVESEDGYAGLVFELSPRFELLMATAADSWGVHDRLNARGKLDHGVADCPMYRTAPPVREWTPAEGWRELRPTGTRVAVRARPGAAGGP